MRMIIPVLLIVLQACAQPPPPAEPAYSPPSPIAVQAPEWHGCLKRDIERRVSQVWSAPAAAGEFPASMLAPDKTYSGPTPRLDEIPAAALEKCVPSYHSGTKYISGSTVQAFADNTYYQAKQKYVAQILEILRDRETRKTAADQASLTREEPAIMNDYHDCIFVDADRLALVSDEPAQVIVSSAYAACHPQRTAIVELHKRYGDAAFNDQVMDRVEAGVAGTLILEVLRVREAVPAPAAPNTPPPLPAPL